MDGCIIRSIFQSVRPHTPAVHLNDLMVATLVGVTGSSSLWNGFVRDWRRLEEKISDDHLLFSLVVQSTLILPCMWFINANGLIGWLVSVFGLPHDSKSFDASGSAASHWLDTTRLPPVWNCKYQSCTIFYDLRLCRLFTMYLRRSVWMSNCSLQSCRSGLRPLASEV